MIGHLSAIKAFVKQTQEMPKKKIKKQLHAKKKNYHQILLIHKVKPK